MVTGKTEPVSASVEDSKKMLDEQMLAILRSQAGASQRSVFVTPTPQLR